VFSNVFSENIAKHLIIAFVFAALKKAMVV
jgi:hypothetical protein